MLYLDRQRAALAARHRPLLTITPPKPLPSVGIAGVPHLGITALTEGHIACVLAAGGHGSRFGYSGPKGTVPLSPICGKSLFQLFAEKVRAASARAHRPLSLAVMTSPENRAETEAYFASHRRFGLSEAQLLFFNQGTLPYLNEEGCYLANSNGQMRQGPDGNGWCFKHLIDSGIWDKWWKEGIRYLTFIPIDNALADPFDAPLIGYHLSHGGEISLKVTERNDPEEQVGLVALCNGKIGVIEYGEFPVEEVSSRQPDGKLSYSYANLSLFCLDMELPMRLNAMEWWEKMPLHPRYKRLPSGEMAWKFERYIFDLLPPCEGAEALVYLREQCFAPLKQKEGPCGIAAVQRALMESDRRTYEAISGSLPPPGAHFELAQEFYYPTDTLYRKWRGILLPPQELGELHA